MAGEPDSLSRAELLDLYKVAVEEYRFQVKLNADRSRDYFVANSAIFAAAITLLGQAKLPLLSGVVFVIGFVVAALSILGTHTQHGYYRDTRNAVRQLERRLGITDLTLIRTKPTGSRYRRFGSVTRFNFVILGLLGTLDIVGAVYSFASALQPAKAPTAFTRAAPGKKPGVHLVPAKPQGASPAPPKRSSPGPVGPDPPTPSHP